MPVVPPSQAQGNPEAYGESTKQHHYGETYGGKNKIPTIGGLIEKQRRRNREQDEAEREEQEGTAERLDASEEEKQEHLRRTGSAEGAGMKSPAQKEKQELMDKAKAGHQNPAKMFKAKGEREVIDPVTKQRVFIRDAEYGDYTKQQLFSREHLDPSDMDKQGPALNVPEDVRKESQGDVTAKGDKQPIDKQGEALKKASDHIHITPSPVEPSNICLQTFPPPIDTKELDELKKAISQYAYAIMGGLGVVWFFVAFRSGFTAFAFRTTLLAGFAGAVFTMHGMVSRRIEKQLERIRIGMHKQRGETFSPPTPESVEWLNALTKIVWPLIDPAMFRSMTDMIEDIMQASLPSFIDAVKIDDFGIGKNAFRVIAMRALPDQPHEEEYPRDEWINQGQGEQLKKEKEEKRKQRQVIEEKEQHNQEETEEDLDESGDYYNFEMSLAYTAPPGAKMLHGENISLIVNFYLGWHDWFQMPVPIWVALESVVCTVRMRCQMVSQAPYIRNLTFTLMGVPKVEASAIPMSRALPNVLDLPLISGFVQQSIAAAANEYVAPRSMTMNMAQILSGDGVKKDTKALGVLMITIHYAVGLSAQDDNGYSDPYVVLAFAKFGKPLFSTRIVVEDLNPVWEETAYLLVTDDEVRSGELLSVQLWDSDMMSADDLVGRTNIPLHELMREPNKMHRRENTLMGFEDADQDAQMDGKLHWSVGYFDKARLNKELKKAPGVDHDLPKELQDRPELQVETKAVDNEEEKDVYRTPPDPRFPAGVLSVMVHQINNLENKNLRGTTGRHREGRPGQDTSEASEMDDNIPSAYCEIIIQDDLVYRTRTKQKSTMPFFNAGLERFVRDWQDTTVRIVVRDARLREKDPVLGIVNLKLRDVFKNASQVTKMWALQDGVGFGRVNVSLLFKGIEIDLPKELRGWDTGTVCVRSPVKVELNDDVTDFDLKAKKLLLATTVARQRLPGHKATKVDNERAVEWNVDEDIRLPVYDRYSSALYFDYGGHQYSVGQLLKDKPDAFAALWLRDVADNEVTRVRVPVIVPKSSRFECVRVNYISDQTAKTHKYDVVGWLTCDVVLEPGLDADHERYAHTQAQRHEYEAYDRVEGMAAQAEENAHAGDDGEIDKGERRKMDEAHKRQLHARHRGVLQYKPVRTMYWLKDGAKQRAASLRRKMLRQDERDEHIETEAS